MAGKAKNHIIYSMKKYSFVPFILTLTVITMLLSCTADQTVYEEYQKFENLSWNRFNRLEYDLQVEDLESAYDIFINIRHIPEVPYKEMVINFTLYTPSGDMRSVDYTLDFYDAEGLKLSECMGDLCDLLVPLRKGFRFYEAGKVKFEIENKFTKVDMPGIMEVGLIVKRSPAEE